MKEGMLKDHRAKKSGCTYQTGIANSSDTPAATAHGGVESRVSGREAQSDDNRRCSLLDKDYDVFDSIDTSLP